MPIILSTERKQAKTRILLGGMYIFLVLAGATMIYPFLLMISGSVKSHVDAYDFDILPAYLYDEGMLLRKFEEAKYNENLQTYLETTGDMVRTFRLIEPPPLLNETVIDDWKEFCRKGMPASYYQVGFAATLEGKIIQENERGFNNYVKKLCNGDLEVFHRKYAPTVENWFFLKMREERLADKNYQVTSDNLMDAYYEYKKTLSPEERIYVSSDGKFSKYVELSPAYKGKIEVYNRSQGTDHASFREITLSERATAGDWESFVREVLNPQFVRVSAQARDGFAMFLKRQYGVVQNLNKLYLSDYRSFEEVPYPEDRIHSSPALTDFSLFLGDRVLLPAEYLSLDTPEIRWREFLRTKYDSLAALSEAHGKRYRSFASVSMPQREADYAHCLTNRGMVRWMFLTRNFKMVFEYILIYGRGIVNTIVYCLLAIGVAVLVNPLAAYALSRYNLPSQYKILLFLMATMAFPPMVTMIPNFLLLRDLGLLNTFAALILPGMANGYAIFLLKGFFDSLPRELYEAAEIDGANEWHKFWLITMNLSKPILAVIALGAFSAAYSNFMFAFILCQDRRMWTLMVWLYQLQQFASQGVVFASLLVAAAPTLLVFILCQSVIIRGIVVPTEK
jgi:ABC-type glycerol-3-phosphate transport system permease component